jgi:hypothetical protein
MSARRLALASMRAPQLAVGLGALALALLVADDVGAKPPKDNARCIESFERSQELRREDKLVAARRELEICAATTCPGPISKSCKTWAGEVAEALPSVVVRTRRADGEIIKGASLTIDGEPVAAALDGQPIELDVGEHRLAVRTPEGEEATTRVTLKAKEKARETWLELPARKVEPAAPAAPAELPPEPSRRGFTAGTITLFSASAIGLGAFIGLGASARGDANDLRTRCSPRCPSADVDPVRTKAIVADVSLGISVVALGAGLYFALSRPAPASGLATAPRLAPFFLVGREQTGAGATLRF